jgi:uncharacterized membrane protein
LSSRYLVQGAVIAALYAALTIILMPISYGAVQIRVSEALTILPAVSPAAVPGLFVGCFIANIVGPNGAVDTILGSLATLLAAYVTYKLRYKPVFILPLPAVLANGIIIGSMLYFVYGVPMPCWVVILWVSIGEAVACYGIGLPLLKYIRMRKLFNE